MMHLLVLISFLAHSFARSLSQSYDQCKSNHTCQSVAGVQSCTPEALAPAVDSCCVEKYGIVLSTQYWPIFTGREAEGQLLPLDSWTVEGLWQTFCDLNYTAYCDLSRQYDASPSPITTTGLDGVNRTVTPYNGTTIDKFIEAFGRTDLLDWMNTYWINPFGYPNPYFWAHIFSKHGTCFSTFQLPCYGPRYVPHEDVIDFFQTAIRFYQRLPTYQWLAAAGITPSNATTYSLSAVQDAIAKGFGVTPYIGCIGPRFNDTAAGSHSNDTGYTQIDEIWYYHYVYGRTQGAHGVPVDAASLGSRSPCATSEGALHYYERTPGSERFIEGAGPKVDFKPPCSS